MIDETQLQARSKDGESSLNLSKVRSGLVARGRKDAAALSRPAPAGPLGKLGGLAEEECFDSQLTPAAADRAYAEVIEFFFAAEERKFGREINRRATEGLTVEYGDEGSGAGRTTRRSVEGAELRLLLTNMDEFRHLCRKLELRVPLARAAEVSKNTELKIDSNTEFNNRADLRTDGAGTEQGAFSAEIEADEESPTFMAMFNDWTDAEHRIGVGLLNQPDFQKCCRLAKQISKFDRPPFVLWRGDRRVVQSDWHSLLEYTKTEGVKSLLIAAEQGDARAQYMLGFAYDTGQGVSRSQEDAMRWNCRAAEQGFAPAQCKLGAILEEAGDHEGAASWFRKAAEGGDARAQLILGLACCFSKAADYVQAHAWTTLAAAISVGDEQKRCISLREQIAGRMTPQQIDEAQELAREWSGSPKLE